MNYVNVLGENVTLAEAGGKGLNLCILAEQGFNVPPGYIVKTEAYKKFVESNNIQRVIETQLALIDEDVETLQEASKAIRAVFIAGTIPEDIREETTQAYIQDELGNVAVRSSATAEDLPETSFAGQQETYLNVEGVDALLRAVVECWGSLWTPRAIGYRRRNCVSQDDVSLAVVVQAMVQSESSGVMFTVNPLTGVRTEAVINATFGLGEALVSGRIEPDEYIVEKKTGLVKSVKIGSKNDKSEDRALSDRQIAELTEIGIEIQEYYGSPQDIEWATLGDELFILQSRPVTGLYPIPDWFIPIPLEVYGSLGHVQGVLQPLTPLGQDIIRQTLGYAQNLVGGHFDLRENTRLIPAGGRLYSKVTELFRNVRYHGLLRTVALYIEPSMGAIMEELIQDPRIEKRKRLPSLREWRYLLPLVVPLIARFIWSVLRPIKGREKTNRKINGEIEYWRAKQSEQETIEEHVSFINQLLESVHRTLITGVIPSLAAGQGMFFQIKMRAEKLGFDRAALDISRGLPYNVTTEMDLMLWEKVKNIRKDPESVEALSQPVEKLVDRYKNRTLPAVFQAELGEFLRKYGIRGVAEIDIASIRWNEDPTHIIQMLQTYNEIDDPEKAPDAMFKRMGELAHDALEEIAEEAGRQHGWRGRHLIRWLGVRQRNLAGLRESPKFFFINLFFTARISVLRIGEMMFEQGYLLEPRDVFYLRLDELRMGNWREIVEKRKQEHKLDEMRKPPRILQSDGHAFYGSVSGDDKSLVGSPVSPGVVEGVAHVMLDPSSEKLLPGEILVCPATDPAWTPLFLAAGGLVMEVGGLMTHGSIVAREYGIPAVVGIDYATSVLKTGQKIKVDGEKGTVTVLD